MRFRAGLLIFFILLVSPVTAFADKSYQINRVDIDAAIQPNGDIVVQELYEYSFDGEFSGTSRTIGEENSSGVTSFKAYEVLPAETIQEIDFDSKKNLEVTKRKEKYKAYKDYENEIAHVYYKYKIKKAARKYEDIGEFYWRFFDESGESALHNVTVSVRLQETNTLPEEVNAFLHDMSSGYIEVDKDRLYYENSFLPLGERFELRFLFPATFLKNMDDTESGEHLERIVQEEESYVADLERKERMIPLVGTVNALFVFGLLALLIYLYLKMKVLRRPTPYAKEIKHISNLDLFTLSVIHTESDFDFTNLNASLFSLYEKGVLSVEIIQDDTKLADHYNYRTFKYTLKSKGNLKKHEQFLIDWLFYKDENNELVFTYDRLPLADKQEQIDGYVERIQFQKTQKEFLKQFDKWKKLSIKDGEVKKYYRSYWGQTVFQYAVFIVWPVWIIGSFYLISESYKLPKAQFMMIILISFAIIIFRTKVFYQIVYAYILIWVTFLFGTKIHSFVTLHHVVGFILLGIAHIIPKNDTTKLGNICKGEVRKWQEMIQAGEMNFSETEEIEHAYLQALTLGVGYEFYDNYKDDMDNPEPWAIHPFLNLDEENRFHFLESLMAYTDDFDDVMESINSSSGSSSSGSRGSGGGGGAGAF